MQVCITLEELWNKMTNGGDVLFLTGREPEHVLLQIWYFSDDSSPLSHSVSFGEAGDMLVMNKDDVHHRHCQTFSLSVEQSLKLLTQRLF